MPTVRSLPGLRFRTETPMMRDLPRMDIAAFVGFAQRGPRHTPVPVESMPEFERIFGGIYPLAWDAQTHTWQMACLATGVQSFFQQGGRRCWVVRVASNAAKANRFAIAGLLQTTDQGLQPAMMAASSVGSWSDGLKVRAELLVDPIALRPETPSIDPQGGISLTLLPTQQQTLQPGDLLRLTSRDGHIAYVPVRAEALQPMGHHRGLRLQVADSSVFWFRAIQPPEPNGPTTWTGTFSNLGPGQTAAAMDSPAGNLTIAQGGEITMTLSPEPNRPIQQWLVAGDWLRFDTEGQWILAMVDYPLSPSQYRLSQAWVAVLQPNKSTLAAMEVTAVQKLQIALKTQVNDEHTLVLSDLALAAPHPRYLGYLPQDEQLFNPGFGPSYKDLAPESVSPEHQHLRETLKQSRFPLSMGSQPFSTPVFLPLGLEQPGAWRGREQQDSDLDPLYRDGLVPDPETNWTTFITELFLDPALRQAGLRSLLSTAQDRLYLQGKSLKGIHALMPIEEISLIAAPDANHRPWQRKETEAATPWQLVPPSETAEADAAGLPVPQAMAELAAARGDVVVVLGMPKHYRAAEALRYQEQLRQNLRSAGEQTLSYVALYHPWLVSRAKTGPLIHTHPAGHVCGVMAARSLDRGAWIAAANEPLRDVLATLPALSMDDEQRFYQAGINPLRASATGIVIWGSYTQSREPELEHLNVRRLLILLRRLALVEGQTLAFAPNSPALHRQVKQQFEQQLGRLFHLGAFVGSNPSEAYQVVLDDTLNTAASIERGRLLVDLRVAPSRPLLFITVRLIQAEHEALRTQEVISHGR